MKIAHGTNLLVVDGTQMLILRNDGDTRNPDLVVLHNQAIANPSNRDLLADAPGVGFASGGFGRDTKDKADPHQENEDRFVADAAAAFVQMPEAQNGSVIVIAPPRALGVLRKHFNPAVKSRVIAEIAKDLTNHPVEEIARLIMQHG